MNSRLRFEIDIVTEDFGDDLDRAMKTAPRGTIWKAIGKEANGVDIVVVSIPYDALEEFSAWYGVNPLDENEKE